MTIYPAIDIKGGKCTRMKHKTDGIVFDNDDPVDVAEEWQKSGASYIHIVDLDGAVRGSNYNDGVLKNILSRTTVPVQIGGGIRSMDDVRRKLSWGASRIILGTSAIKSPAFVEEAVSEFGEKIAVGIDAINGGVVVSGRAEATGIKPMELLKNMTAVGVKTFIYTDITQDGTKTGPNIQGIQEIQGVTLAGTCLIVAGGISGMEDIEKIHALGVCGVVLDRALYMGAIKLDEVMGIYG